MTGSVELIASPPASEAFVIKLCVNYMPPGMKLLHNLLDLTAFVCQAED